MVDRYARPILLVGLGLVLFGAGVWFWPFVASERTVVRATPSPFPTSGAANIDLPPGGRTCLDGVALTPDDGTLLILAASRAGGRVAAELTGPGYAHRTVVSLPASPTPTPVGVPVASPRSEVLAEVCLRNLGRRTLALGGPDEPRAEPRASGTLDGRPTEEEVALKLLQRDEVALLGEAGDVLDRAAIWKPGILATPVLWLLLVLVVIAVGAGVVVTFAATVRREDAG